MVLWRQWGRCGRLEYGILRHPQGVATYPTLIVRLSTAPSRGVPLPLASGGVIPTLHSPYDYLLPILYYLYRVDKREKRVDTGKRCGTRVRWFDTAQSTCYDMNCSKYRRASGTSGLWKGVSAKTEASYLTRLACPGNQESLTGMSW